MAGLTQDLMMQYRKAFATYGKDKDGKIIPKDLGVVMRSLGYNPTEQELQVRRLYNRKNHEKSYFCPYYVCTQKMINQMDAERKDGIDFNDFLNIMQKQREYVETEEDVLEAFR